MKTKLFTLFLALVASVGTISAESGACGDNLTWDLTDSVLTISGTGDMYDFNGSTRPWGIGIKRVIIEDGVTRIGGCAFCESNLTSIEIPNSVTSIGSRAFDCCLCLTSITIPNSVDSIGDAAFRQCIGLISAMISNPQIKIGQYGAVFAGCYNLRSYYGPAAPLHVDDIYLAQLPISKYLESVIVTGEEMTENAFVFIGGSYKTLKSIDLSATTNTEIADEAFKGCYNLETLKLPANLENIGYMAVAECVKLKSIDIPASVIEIADRAFEDCRSIETITFGGAEPSPVPGRNNAPKAASQLKRIGNWAFYNAHELQHLTIPEGVTEIGDGAFYGCTYLEDLVLPSSVQSIGDNCFALCAKMGKIVVNSVTPPTIAAKTFFDVNRRIPVYVPDNCVDAYESDPYWSEFDIQGISNMPEGIDNTFSSLQGGDRGRLILRDGQVLILRGDKTYTLTGQEVK